MRSTKTVKLASLGLAAGLVLAACGDDDGDAGTGIDGAAAAATGASEGTIAISGSSTVAPISSIVADDFNLDSPAQITVDDPGTGDGFAAFCSGEIDIADASRPIKAEEAEACEAAGIAFVELEIAFDGITVMTNGGNDAVECLSFADLYALVGPESEGFDRWAEAQAIADALGSTTELPDAPLDITAPGTESGTYDAFVELVVEAVSEERVAAGAIGDDEAATIRSDYSSQADDNAIIAGIEGSDTSFGWVGFAFADGAGDSVKPLEVDGGDGCVAPSIDTIADGSYPISRSLYIYVDPARVDENPALGEYVDFYLQASSMTDLVEEAGYVPLPDDRAEATRERWASRTTGTAGG